jgi:hypothetical protein
MSKRVTWPRVYVNVLEDYRTAAVNVEFRGPNDGLIANVVLSHGGAQSLRDQIVLACAVLDCRRSVERAEA